ncbi:hypothetical protein [Magnetospirillum sp. 15-1]|uniref:hypothetical protein n=1 Tax=Magnetospirillum sp. 15-1 TaxID=1979370 RepID=UPI001483B6CB|nr:hypothetical protein [Magnetospirillum sp. 15-1]
MSDQHSLAVLLMQANHYDRQAALLAREGRMNEAEEAHREAITAWRDIAKVPQAAQH